MTKLEALSDEQIILLCMANEDTWVRYDLKLFAAPVPEAQLTKKAILYRQFNPTIVWVVKNIHQTPNLRGFTTAQEALNYLRSNDDG